MLTEGKMMNDKNSATHDHQGGKGMNNNGLFGAIYGIAFIGAAVYYIQHAATFWAGALGIFKALFWPAVLMYKLLELLKM
jgi:hypothetical protein